MALSDLASIGSFVSGVVVFVSLIYLSLQVRQAEKNQQASIRQGRTDRVVEINLKFSDPAVADAVDKGMTGAEDISRTELRQFRGFFRASFYNAEDSFYRHKEGLLNEAAFASYIASQRSAFILPGYRAAWKLTRNIFQAEFVEFMDKLLGEAPVLTISEDPLAQWKASVAKEKGLATT